MDYFVNYIENMIDVVYLGNTVGQYLVAFGIFCTLFVIILMMFKKLRVYLDKFLKRRRKHSGDEDMQVFYTFLKIVRYTPRYFLVILVFYLPLKSLTLNPDFEFVVDIIFYVLLVIQMIRIMDNVIVHIFAGILIPSSKQDETTMNIISVMVKIFLRVIGGALLLINFGVEITPLLASLGIGGIAVAFAFKNILEDVFASFSIFFTKPFKVGDFVDVGGDMGTIHEIGFKSTRMQTLHGEDLIIPNKKIVETSVSNFATIKRRREKINLGVTYETSPKLLRKIPEICQNVIESVESTTFSWASFRNYGSYSLDFEVVYFVELIPYNDYLQIAQEVNFRLFEAFAKHNIDFAYPTQTVYEKGQKT